MTTGYVKITNNWVNGKGEGIRRFTNTLLDKTRTAWLPIWCFVIEHEAGLIVIDTGIPENANDPVYFPPYMPLLQRAATFKILREEEIGYQMLARGLNPDDVRYVILTHLHQDHDGGIHHFPNAEFIVSRDEWT
ncbi:MAG: N-acyl homoserine lactonase family protein, partial [Phototrophicales bacterium]